MLRLHTKAVEAALEAAAHDLTAADRPLVELARSLAKQMDDAGDEGPGTRLAATYLTTVRTLNAHPSTVPRLEPHSKLARLRAQAAMKPKGAA
jgi:hypothetical protein